MIAVGQLGRGASIAAPDRYEIDTVCGGKRGRVPELWDGRAAERIADELAIWLGASHRRGTGTGG